MPDQNLIESPPSAPRRSLSRHLAEGASARAICLCVMLTALAWIAALFLRGRPLEVQWIAQMTLALAALLSSAYVSLHHLIHWARPTRQLVRAIQQARAGQIPIEELSHISGGPAPVVAAVQQLLHDLRRQRADYVSLEQEIAQRLANRTDALQRVIGSLRQQAERDPLTGLCNRRALNTHLPQLIERCAADSTPLSLLILDVDHFKQVNDTLGHPAGDRLLRNVAQLIQSGIRDQDLAFRYGGDEFVVVLSGQGSTQAARLAQRLGLLMDALGQTLHVGQPPRLSVGVATLSELNAPTAEAFIQAADQRLYALKQARQTPTAA